MRACIMVSLGVVVAYLFLVFVVVTIVVLFCLGCGCHAPLGKMVRCLCENTTFCCARCFRRKGAERRKTFGNIINDVSEERAKADERRAQKERIQDDASVAGCCAWIPWILTCGMCCGALSEEGEAIPGRASAASTNPNISPNVIVAQPVMVQPNDDAIGPEAIVTSSIPLLTITQ